MRITTNPIVGGGYEAPEIEVITTAIEQGFTMSASIDLASEDNYGSF